MVDMDQFVAQISPLIVLMILFPASLILLYYTVLRPLTRRFNQQNQDKTKAASTTAPSALDMLRQAQMQGAMEESPVMATATASAYSSSGRNLDTGDLPDLGSLLTPVSAKKDLPPVSMFAPKPAPASRPAPAPVRQISDSPQRLKLNTGDTTQAKEMITVLRDENDGRLMVQIGETGYRSLVDSPEAKKLFTTLMKELSSSIMTPDSRPSILDSMPVETLPAETPRVETAPVAADPIEIPPVESLRSLLEDTPPVEDTSRPRSSSLDALRSLAEPLPAAKPQPRPTTPKPSEPRRTVAPPPLADGSIPGAIPSYKFDDNPAKITLGRGGTVKKVEFTPPPAVDIPSAIEAYLQYKIQYEPEYQGLGIHIRPGLGGGVRIQVGEFFYDAVDDVEDDDIRAFMKEAIAEWQERFAS